MCGLVGIIAKPSFGLINTDVEIFKQLLFVDMLRGEDATGVAIVDNEQGVDIYKEASEAIWFLDKIPVKNALTEAGKSGKALLGHNRKATIGGKSDKNAHPFVYDDRYVFFHNGTLNNHKTFGDDEVDSESFGRHIVAAEGDVDKLAEVFHKAYGAWALVWYDSVKHTVYFCRNAQRPLSLITLKNGNIVYSSEAWMGQAISARNNSQIEKAEALDVDTLYSVDLNDSKLEIKKDPLPKKATPVTTYRGGVTTGIVSHFITKAERRRLAKSLASLSYVNFLVKDAISSNITGKEDAQQCYDWLLTGTNAMYPGAEFEALAKNKFPWEIERIKKQGAWGYVEEVENKDGKILVKVEDVNYFTGALCH